jgi:hypothetical protein
VRLVRALLRFLYGFLVGDDWKVTVGVGTSLLIGAVLLALAWPVPLVVILTAGLLALSFVASLVIDVARRPD